MSNKLFDKIRQHFMPETKNLEAMVKERIISQKGMIPPPTKNRFIEDSMEVDTGEFRLPLEEFEEHSDTETDALMVLNGFTKSLRNAR